MIVSFAWTTPALLAGAKTVTRRDWTHDYARRFTPGLLVDAWNQTPRVNSRRRGIAIARKVATIQITREPYRSSTAELTEDDYRREGFEWLREHGHHQTVAKIMESWGQHPREVWVVEFKLVEVVPYP